MTTLQSDIRVLDNLLALNLNISLGSARKKMTPEDLGGAELPPEDLASLGSKRVADPASLKVFGTLKSRAFAFMDRHGIRIMSGWAIPEDKAEIIVNELISIREEFVQANTAFLVDRLAFWRQAKDAQFRRVPRRVPGRKGKGAPFRLPRYCGGAKNEVPPVVPLIRGADIRHAKNRIATARESGQYLRHRRRLCP